MKDTKQQFEHVIAICRDLFAKKLHDYGAAWRIMRPSSVTDQIFIKANRIRSIEIKGVTMVDEGIRSEFIAIVNYGIIGLIQVILHLLTNLLQMGGCWDDLDKATFWGQDPFKFLIICWRKDI